MEIHMKSCKSIIRGYGLVLGMCSRELITRMMMCRGTIPKTIKFLWEDNY